MVSGEIPYSRLGYFTIGRDSPLQYDQIIWKKAKRLIHRELVALKYGLANPLQKPKERPPRGIPLARGPYKASMSNKGVPGRMVKPGRLRRASGLGLKHDGGVRLSRWKQNGQLIVRWGVTRKEMGALFKPYGGYVSDPTTHAGKRWSGWDIRTRRFLRKRLIKIAEKVNRNVLSQMKSRNYTPPDMSRVRDSPVQTRDRITAVDHIIFKTRRS